MVGVVGYFTLRVQTINFPGTGAGNLKGSVYSLVPADLY